jgi:hypothetical protein
MTLRHSITFVGLSNWKFSDSPARLSFGLNSVITAFRCTRVYHIYWLDLMRWGTIFSNTSCLNRPIGLNLTQKRNVLWRIWPFARQRLSKHCLIAGITTNRSGSPFSRHRLASTRSRCNNINKDIPVTTEEWQLTSRVCGHYSVLPKL